jgi:hypothetical protein
MVNRPLALTWTLLGSSSADNPLNLMICVPATKLAEASRVIWAPFKKTVTSLIVDFTFLGLVSARD